MAPCPGKGPLDAISAKGTQPTFALLNGFRKSSAQDRLAQLGCALLRDGLHDQFEVSRTVFECLLPQLSYALPSVNAAAAALGAVYEMQTASASTIDGKTVIVAAQYGAAVREVQRELLARPYGAVPILVACMLLACVDVLLYRMRLALMHVRGAMRLLEERNASMRQSCTGSADAAPLEEEDDDLTLFFRTLDIQTISYADGLPPEMHVAHVRPPLHTASASPCVYRTDRELIALIQACLSFTSRALQYRYRPPSLAPVDLSVEQGRHIAALRLWLRYLDYEVLPFTRASPCHAGGVSSKYMHCLVLRNLCLSAITYTSQILNPHETGWDAYAHEFEEIITGAELILGNRRCKGSQAPSPSAPPFTFTPSPGIIQPLYLTVLKYRHPQWRRRALELLRQCDKEGPWDGKLMAAAGQCAMDAEESELVEARSRSIDVELGCFGEDAGKVDLAVLVPERVRISGCRPDNGTDEEDAPDWEWMKEGEFASNHAMRCRMKTTLVRLSRCKDVQRMLVAGLHRRIPDDNAAWLQEHWERWTETVELPHRGGEATAWVLTSMEPRGIELPRR